LLSDVGDSAKKYKTGILSLNHKDFEFFYLVPKSATHTVLISLNTLEPNILTLSPAAGGPIGHTLI
jgi:hypothetical protein